MGLQELTRKLQDERDALAAQVEELTQQLSKTESTQLQLTNDLQVKELEVLHVQQVAQDQQANLHDRIQELQKELEAERMAHQLTQIAQRNTNAKVSKLTAEVQQTESKWRKEMAKKEALQSEVAHLQDQLRHVELDREQLIARTEADAKKVRELWQQIVKEHEDRRNLFQQKLQEAQVASQTLEKELSQQKSARQQALGDNEKLVHELQVVTEKLTQVAGGRQETNHALEHLQRKEKKLTNQLADQRVLVEKLSSKVETLRQNEQLAVKERQLMRNELKKCRQQLQDKTQELLMIKTEFSDLLDKNEHLTHDFKQQALERESQVQVATQKLQQDKQFNQEMVVLLKNEVAGYRKVIRTLNNKLSTARDTVASSEMNAWQLTMPSGQGAGSSPNSLCILRH